MQISGLTNYEYVSIMASFVSRINDRFNCFNCLTKYKGELGDKERRYKACKKAVPRTIIERDNVRFTKCPGNFNNQTINFFYSAHQFYKKGIMPFDGGMGDQPAQAVEAIELIDGLYAKYELELMEKNNRGK